MELGDAGQGLRIRLLLDPGKVPKGNTMTYEKLDSDIVKGGGCGAEDESQGAWHGNEISKLLRKLWD